MQSCSTRVLSARRCQRQTAWTLWGSLCRSVTSWSCLVSHWTLVWRWTGTSPEFYPVRSCNSTTTCMHCVTSANCWHSTLPRWSPTVLSYRGLDYANVRYVCHQPQQAARRSQGHPALRIITDYMLTNLYLLSYSRFLSNLHPPPLMKHVRVPVARVLY